MLLKFSVKKPFIVLTAAVIVAALGVASLINISKEVFENFNPPCAVVVTEYPSAGSEVIELSITKPLEESFGEIESIETINSLSDKNYSMIFIEFKYGADMVNAIDEISLKTNLISDNFDENASMPKVIEINPQAPPIMIASVYSDEMGYVDISKQVNSTIIPTLEQIPDIALVSALGVASEYINIYISNEKIAMFSDEVKEIISAQFDDTEAQILEAQRELEALRAPGLMGNAVYYNPEYQIQVDSLAKQLEDLRARRSEVETSTDVSSKITSEVITNALAKNNLSVFEKHEKSDAKEYFIKAENVSDINKIGDIELFTLELERNLIVKLSDIADIKTSDNSNEIYSKSNGNDSVILLIQKRSTASTAEVCRKVDNIFDKLCADNAALNITSLSNHGEYIDTESLSLLRSIAIGIFLAAIVMIILFKHIGVGIIIAISTPIILLFSLSLMYISNVSINIFSIIALIILAVMIIGAEVTVIRSIYNLHYEGSFSPKEAAMLGARRVAPAIIASAMTILCILLPILFISGAHRKAFVSIALTAVISSVCTLVTVFTLIPSLASLIIKKTNNSNNIISTKILDSYEKILLKALKLKPVVLVTSMVILALSAWAVYENGFEFIPKSDVGEIMITAQIPDDANSKNSHEIGDNIIKSISNIKGIKSFGIMQNRFDLMPLTSESESGKIHILLKLEDIKKSTEIVDIIKNNTAELNYELTIESRQINLHSLANTSINNAKISYNLHDILIIFLIAVLFIFIVMTIKLRSVVSSLILIFSTALALAGGFIAILIFGIKFSVLAALGAFITAIFILGNGISFIDYTNKITDKGIDKRKALVLSARGQAKSVLIISISYILFLVPTALSVGGVGVLSSLTISSIGGIIYGAFISLIVIPVLYGIRSKTRI